MEEQNEYEPSYDWLISVRDGIGLLVQHMEDKLPSDLKQKLHEEARTLQKYANEKIMFFSRVRLGDFSK